MTKLLGLLIVLSLSAYPTCRAGENPPRAARSVHLHYSAPESVLFYNEVKIEESQNSSYFCVCGFDHGYFGIQQLRSPDDKVVIFSVWDPGKQDDPKIVPDEKRVEVLEKAEDVRVGRFGGEGTGGQSFFKYNWKVGEPYCFMIKAAIDEKKTSYAAYFLINETKEWKHLVTFRVLTGGDKLTGYYSFVEDFRRDGKSATERRRARYGNGWIKTPAGEWKALREATFTADNTPANNIDAGIVETDFFLATGGDTQNHTPLISKIVRKLSEDAIAPHSIRQ